MMKSTFLHFLPGFTRIFFLGGICWELQGRSIEDNDLLQVLPGKVGKVVHEWLVLGGLHVGRFST